MLKITGRHLSQGKLPLLQGSQLPDSCSAESLDPGAGQSVPAPFLTLPVSVPAPLGRDRGAGAGGRQGSGTGPPGHRQPCRASRPPRWLRLWACSLTPGALTFQAWGCVCPESRRDCSSWKGTNWLRSRVHTSHTTCDTERGARRQPSGAPTAGRPVGRQGTAGGLSCAHSGPTGLPEVPSLLPTQECHLPVCLL